MAKIYRTYYYTLAASVQILCHRERSVAICWQGDCFHHATNVARGRLTFRLRGKSLLRVRNDKN